MKQRGIVNLFLIILIPILILVGIGILSSKGTLPQVVSGILGKPTPEALSITLSSQYVNPFNNDVQYINPFSTYQNPFDSLK